MAAVATLPTAPIVVPGTRRRRRRARQARRWASAATTGGLLVLAVLWLFTLRPQSLGGPAGYVMVRGVSMEPTFHGGDLVIVGPADTYGAGDVIAYRVRSDENDDGVIVIHRIIGGTTLDGLILQGDNNQAPDEWHPKQADIVGKAWFQLPRVGLILNFLHAPLPLASLAMGVTVAILLVPSKKQSARQLRCWRAH